MNPRLILSLWFVALCIPAALTSLPAPAPQWIVNLYQKSLHNKTLTHMLDRVRTPGITDHEPAKRF